MFFLRFRDSMVTVFRQSEVGGQFAHRSLQLISFYQIKLNQIESSGFYRNIKSIKANKILSIIFDISIYFIICCIILVFLYFDNYLTN